MAMEGFLARWYARNTAKNRDLYRETAAVVASKVASGGSVLEVAPGPGYLAIELAKMGSYNIVGLDISKSFVEMGRRNAQEAGVAVTFEHGNASAMPFDADTFDFIVCRAAFKNFTEPVHAIQEMHRVLKPGGKAMIADLRPDATDEAIRAEVTKLSLGWFNAWLTRLIFKYSLIRRAYSQAQFRQMAAQTSFKTCEIDEAPIGLTVWLTKQPV
jgi:ubiquinone/menaquinone biosynthesis C-methylase UbiE